jgi:hypothetical protein
MQDYIDKFCELIDQLQAYSHNIDHVYYTTRFIDGLHDEIKHVILVQRPPNLDTACCLTLLQEENGNGLLRDTKKSGGTSVQRPYFRGAMPLPRSPLPAKSETIVEGKPKQTGQKV